MSFLLINSIWHFILWCFLNALLIQHGLKPSSCLDANVAGVDEECRKVQYAFFECKRSLVSYTSHYHSLVYQCFIEIFSDKIRREHSIFVLTLALMISKYKLSTWRLISIHFLKKLVEKICLKIKAFSSGWSFCYFSYPALLTMY